VFILAIITPTLAPLLRTLLLDLIAEPSPTRSHYHRIFESVTVFSPSYVRFFEVGYSTFV